jgi:hypothetical protein
VRRARLRVAGRADVGGIGETVRVVLVETHNPEICSPNYIRAVSSGPARGSKSENPKYGDCRPGYRNHELKNDPPK